MLKLLKDKDVNLLIYNQDLKKLKCKRIFYLIAKKNTVRGDHAHKKCTQSFFSIKGSFYIECINSKGEKKKIKIKPNSKLIKIKPFNWVKVYLKKNNICAVICDRHYEEKDYIRDFNKFKNIITFNAKRIKN